MSTRQRGVLYSVLGAGVVGGLLYQSVFNVPSGHRAVIFNRFIGVKQEVYPEGIHFKMPFVEHPTLFDVKLQPFTEHLRLGEYGSEIDFSVRVLARLSTKDLPTTYKLLGPNALNVVVPPITHEACKSITENKTFDQLVTQRLDIRKEIRDSLEKRGKEFGIDVVDVAIVSFVVALTIFRFQFSEKSNSACRLVLYKSL